MHRLALLAPVLLLAAVAVEGQVPTPTPDSGVRPAPAIPRPANDSIFRRARRLVSEGNGAAGRALVDSILQTSNPATPAYGEALYWHGALAPTAAEAERDYRRVIVEYPLSYYADDALLSIAELEQARGDRAGALQHLQRFVREHPASSARGIAALGAARLAFEQRDQKTACAMLTEARTAATSADVELRNQIDYYSGRCTEATAASPPGVVPSAPANTSSPVAVTPTTASAPAVPVHGVRPPAPSPVIAPSSRSARSPAMPGPATRAPTSPREKFPPAKPSAGASRPTAYTIQVAAYNTQSDAERLVTKLATRGVKARVSGTSKPFRVRLGLYETRQEANKEVAALKRRGIIGFVAEEARPANGRSP